MSDLLPGLVVLAIGGSIAPPLLLLTILFLGSQRPLPNAGALALGYFTTCAVIGISGITLFSGAEAAVSTVGRVISVTIGVLLLVLGLRTVLAPPDPDSTPPKWMESIDSMSPPRAFGFGMVLFPLQVKNLAIIGLYAAAPHRASKLLVSLRTWMEKNNRTITVVLCLVFGAFFLLRGFMGA